ncbi:MAG: hypothetical protein AAB037_07220, partial [Chloroflexota bacterium]
MPDGLLAHQDNNQKSRGLPMPLRWLQRLNLWPRLVITVTLGFLVLFGIFSLLSLGAVNDITNRILQGNVDLETFASITRL